MPHFEQFYANKLRGSLGLTDAEAVLDLRGATREQAAASIQGHAGAQPVRGQQDRGGAPRSPARGRAGETLFQPIGRALLEAKKRGWVDRLQTLPSRTGLGFYVALAGRPSGPGTERPTAGGASPLARDEGRASGFIVLAPERASFATEPEPPFETRAPGHLGETP
jgi:hypothetical protein